MQRRSEGACRKRHSLNLKTNIKRALNSTQGLGGVEAMKNSFLVALCLLAMLGATFALTGCLERSPSNSGQDDDAEGIDDDDATSDDDETNDEDDDWSNDDDDDWDDDEDDDWDDDSDLGCERVCDKMMECGRWYENDDPENGEWGDPDGEDWDECFAMCEQSEYEMRECVMEQECDDIWECFEEERPEQACHDYCWKMAECGEMDEREFDECLHECFQEPGDHIWCVLEVECEEIWECFEEEPFEEGCIDYCWKLMECGELPPEEFSECFIECVEEPDDSIWCVLEAECEEIWECFEDDPWPDSICGQFCEKHVDCDLIPEWEFDECMDWCWDEPFGYIVCIIENECRELDECWEEPPLEPDCPMYCEKLAECGWFIDEDGQFNDDEFMMCMETCFDQVDDDEFWCVVENECPEIYRCFE
jgi:hypothetical protein